MICTSEVIGLLVALECAIACSTLDGLHRTCCMHLYGSELWYLNCNYEKDFKVAWRKVKRRMWKLPHKADNAIVHSLFCIALHCIALHCIALHCIALHCIALHCIALHCIALHCIALHCIALHCIALHCIALYCIVL